MSDPEVQIIESIDDLEILSQGDVVGLVYKYKRGETREKLAAYHGKSKSDQLQFVTASIGTSMIVYSSRRGRIEITDGKVVLNEKTSLVEPFSSNKPEYESFNQTLQKSGLRK